MSVGGRLANAWNIFIYSFRLLGKDKSLIAIPVIMLFSSVIVVIGLFVGIVGAAAVIGGSNILWYAVFILGIYIWITFLSAAQSWMVYEVAKGKDTTVGSGFKRAGKEFFDILLFSLAFLALFFLRAFLRGRGKLGDMGASFIGLISGIAGKLVLPAMIVTEKHFGEAVMDLGRAAKSWPEIATYEIGIRPLKSLAVFIGVLLTILLFLVNPLTGIIFLLLFVVSYILVVKYVEVTYYTLVYVTLVEKKKIKDFVVAR